MRRLVTLFWLCTLGVAGVARSTTVIPPTFDSLVSSASTIFVGEVVDVRADWVTTPRGRAIKTFVTFKVDDVWKGALGPLTQLDFLGGQIGRVRMDVADMPAFTRGQRSVLFVSSEVRTASPLVGFSYGRLRIERDASNVDRIRADDGRSIGSAAEVTAQRVGPAQATMPMALSELRAAVRGRIQPGQKR